MTGPEVMLTTPQLVEATGATYRQLDHWVRARHITPAAVAVRTKTGDRRSSDRPTGAPGSGYMRLWAPGDAPVIARMVRAVAAGIAHPAAARCARHPGEPVELAPGVLVTIQDPP